MMMIVRNTDYEEVLNAARGRKVAIWTCNTCARLCNGIGGQQAADRLSEKLRMDGVDVRSSVSTSAACLMSKVNAKTTEIPKDADIVISLTCDTGVICAARAFGKDVLAPLVTLGTGFMDGDGTLVVISGEDMKTPSPLNDIADRKGMSTTPLV
jgi:hypothetical protein